MEMIARIGVVILFVPSYGFDAISFADAAAWFAADLYIIPVCILLLRRIKAKGT
jgi:C4-dicarboxylate transporter DctM subunit